MGIALLILVVLQLSSWPELFSIYYTGSPFTPRNLPTHRSHQLSRDQMLLCDWAALYSVAEQLVVRRVPRPLPSFAEVGMVTQD